MKKIIEVTSIAYENKFNQRINVHAETAGEVEYFVVTALYYRKKEKGPSWHQYTTFNRKEYEGLINGVLSTKFNGVDLECIGFVLL